MWLQIYFRKFFRRHQTTPMKLVILFMRERYSLVSYLWNELKTLLEYRVEIKKEHEKKSKLILCLKSGRNKEKTKKSFSAKTVKKFSRAWQAYFLSYNLKIWWEDISFKDIQMVFNHDFDTSSGFQFRKNQCECSIHILRSPWLR